MMTEDMRIPSAIESEQRKYERDREEGGISDANHQMQRWVP